MAGHSISVAREIIAEPEQVWGVLIDIDRASKVLTNVMSVERLEGPAGYQVGTRWRETRGTFGKTESAELTVTAIDPGRSTTIEWNTSGVVFTATYRVKPSSLGTRLECDFVAESANAGLGQRVAWAVFGNAGAKATQHILEQDLADIGAALR